MEKILIVGHGSPKKTANNIEHVAGLLHNMIHPDCGKNCVSVAYLQFANPDILEAITECVRQGAKKIIIHPYFLSNGMHVSSDIPEIIKDAERKYPGVEFVYTEPLGIHDKMAQVVLERIHAASGLKPGEIEGKSFEIISDEADLSDVPEENLPVVKRVIHATADFEFKNSLAFHPDAVNSAITAIKAGTDILTDVEMVRTGINKKLLEWWGGKALCSLQSVESGEEDGQNKTRTERGIEKALKEQKNIGIIAIGNAPTALLKTIEILTGPEAGLHERENFPVVIGVPVGFVKALESKVLLAEQRFPFITNISRKGGSPVAAAIVNALLKIAAEEKGSSK